MSCALYRALYDDVLFNSYKSRLVGCNEWNFQAFQWCGTVDVKFVSYPSLGNFTSYSRDFLKLYNITLWP